MRQRSSRKTFLRNSICVTLVVLCSWQVARSQLGQIARPATVEQTRNVHARAVNIEEIFLRQTPAPLTEFTGVVVLHSLAGFSDSDFERLVQNCSQISAEEAHPHFSLLKCPRPNPTLRTPHGTMTGRGLYVTSAWRRTKKADWRTFNFRICSDQVCHIWPNAHRREGSILTPTGSPNETLRFASHLVLASDFMDNFWHASIVMNAWCDVLRKSTIHDTLFVGIPAANIFQRYVYDWLVHIGIDERHIVALNSSVGLMAKKITLVRRYDEGPNVDWGCLHTVLRRTRRPQGKVVVIHRSTSKPDRDISSSTHSNLVAHLQRSLTDHEIVTFRGEETFEETRDLFGTAVAVIGPHGAAFANVIFCSKTAIVFEFMTREILRPWQLYGGLSIGLTWVPILLSSFMSGEEIVASVDIIADVLVGLRATQRA